MVPAAHLPFGLDADLGSFLLFQQVQRDLSKDGEILCCMVGADAAVVLIEGHIEDPM